jgi:hypothetical protein
MAESINVFVASDLPLEAFVKEVASVLELQFRSVADQHDAWYETRTRQGKLTIGTHELENDRDLKFDDFKFEIDFWVNRELDENSAEQVRQTSGRKIFDALKQTNKFSLMLVDDVQCKLDEFHPQQAGS